MNLYFVQHGIARSANEDPERPLTDIGRNEVLRISSFLADKDISTEKIYNRGKLRTRKTAEIIAGRLGLEGYVSEAEGLSPNDDPEFWLKRLYNESVSIMLVGNLPHLSRLASLLLKW